MMMKRTLLVLAAAVLAAGCASQEGGETAARTDDQAAEAATASVDAVPAQAEMTTITGTMGCGHCTYKTTSSCSPAVQTDAGVVWILEGVEKDSELFTGRMDMGVVTVTGTRRAENGTHYLGVASYEAVPAEASETTEG